MSQKLDSLIHDLKGLSSRVNLEDLGQILKKLDLAVDEVREFRIFGEKTYRRNLISESAWYNLMLMCWKPGQCSPIHDHAGSSCGFLILEGTAKEVVYEVTQNNFAKPTHNTHYPQGSICLANDNDIHNVGNESNEDLVTLHIYSPPLRMAYYKLDPLADDFSFLPAENNNVISSSHKALAGEALTGASQNHDKL